LLVLATVIGIIIYVAWLDHREVIHPLEACGCLIGGVVACSGIVLLVASTTYNMAIPVLAAVLAILIGAAILDKNR
jgi:hypothetical protein